MRSDVRSAIGWSFVFIAVDSQPHLRDRPPSPVRLAVSPAKENEEGSQGTHQETSTKGPTRPEERTPTADPTDAWPPCEFLAAGSSHFSSSPSLWTLSFSC